MTGSEVALRAVSFAAMVLMVGTSLFVLYAPESVPRGAPLRMQRGAAAMALAASALWLLDRAAAVSGQAVPQVFEGDTLAVVLRETVFGRASAIRLALILLACILPASRRADGLRAASGGAALASVAWNGHAVATPGYLHLCADAVHLLAAGAWVGGLIPLAWALARAPADGNVVLTRRFSRMGLACVLALLVTGAVNAWLLVGSPHALADTAYGRLLSIKLAMFMTMLVLAGVNHFRFTPRLPQAAAARGIAANATIEALLGLAVLAVVGALGVMMPAAHSGMLMR